MFGLTVIDNCASAPCQFGGVCTNAVNTFTCACPPGFTGHVCDEGEWQIKYFFQINAFFCVDNFKAVELNFVFKKDLFLKASMFMFIEELFCIWACCFCLVIDNCVDGSCLNGGTCINGINAFLCECDIGYTDDTCSTGLNLIGSCFTSSNLIGLCPQCFGMMLNQFYCIWLIKQFSHRFKLNWMARSTVIDNCISVPCQNGGLCINGVNTFSCQCLAGYTDSLCTTGQQLLYNSLPILFVRNGFVCVFV